MGLLTSRSFAALLMLFPVAARAIWIALFSAWLLASLMVTSLLPADSSFKSWARPRSWAVTVLFFAVAMAAPYAILKLPHVSRPVVG